MGLTMSNMKRWMAEVGLTHRQLAVQLHQSPVSVTQKVNLHTHWQRRDCAVLREQYGLSADFVQDLIPYETAFPNGVQEVM